MIDERDLFVRAAERFDPPEDAYQRFVLREDRHQRNRRTGALVVAIVVIALVFGGIARAILRAQRQRPITPPPAGIFDPVRGWIAVGDQSGIEAINPKKPSQNVLLTGETGDPLEWSHDGQQLLVNDGPRGALWILHSDGSIEQLPHTEGAQGGSFTPDGSAVVFVDEGEIKAIDLATGTLSTVVAKPPDGTHFLLPARHGGQLSPDGHTIAVIVLGPGREWNITLFDLVDDSSRVIVDGATGLRLHGTPDFQGLVPASWSPDGTRILFSTEGKYDCIVAIIDADGTNLQRLTPQGTCFANPSWSPDGQLIAVTNYGDTLRIMNPDGTDVRDVHLENGGGIAVWNPLMAPRGPSTSSSPAGAS